jgi:hypothetical protein
VTGQWFSPGTLDNSGFLHRRRKLFLSAIDVEIKKKNKYIYIYIY